jgi:ATP-dependent protease ClpP protease subunit
MAHGTKPQKAVAYTQMIEGEPSVFVTGFIYEGFGTYLGQYVYDAFQAHGPVTLYINSNGGILGEAFAFYDFVRAKGIALNVEVFGTVGSAATIIAAAAGRENIHISENSDWFVHRVYFVNEWGERIDGNPEEAARLNGLLVNAYMVLTGMDEAAVNALLDKGDNNASISAADAVSMGFAADIIPASKAAAFKQIAEANKPKDMTKVAVKLNFGKAVAAALGNEVTTEIDVDAAVAAQLTEKDEEIATLKGQIATLEEATKPVDGAVDAATIAAELETVKAQNEEHVKAIATKEAALAEKETALNEVSAKLAAALKPAAGPTIGTNASAAVAGMPNSTPENPNVIALRGALAATPSLQKAK